jgi:hypothetical protein
MATASPTTPPPRKASSESSTVQRAASDQQPDIRPGELADHDRRARRIRPATANIARKAEHLHLRDTHDGELDQISLKWTGQKTGQLPSF